MKKWKPPKQCKFCGDPEPNHWPYQCRMNPRAKKKIAQYADIKWQQLKREWFETHPADYYTCYLQISPICPKVMAQNETTLDHVIPKSRGEKYKYDIHNLRPCCWACNSEKGSKVLDSINISDQTDKVT